MKKILLTVATALLSLAMFAQNADSAFVKAWSAKHNKNNQYSGFLMDFTDSTIFSAQAKMGFENEQATECQYTMTWDATAKALKIHYKYIGFGKNDNYNGTVAIGTKITKKNDSTSAGSTTAFNPFLENDSIICTNYINMTDTSNRTIAVYCKLVDNTDSATIRLDIFDVNGRKTNFDNSSVKKGIKPSPDYQKIIFNWGYDSGGNADNVGGWNEDAATFYDGYSGDFWGVKTGHWDAAGTPGLPRVKYNQAAGFQVPLDAAYMIPKFSFSTNGGSKVDPWVKAMAAGTLDKEYDVFIQKIEFGKAPFWTEAPVETAKAKKITPNVGSKFTFEGQGTMVNILGQTVATGNGVIDASQLSEGVYYIIIDSEVSKVIVK